MQLSLKEIYQQVPSFNCKEGCSDCCGLVPFNRWEISLLSDEHKEVMLVFADMATSLLSRGIVSACPLIGRGKLCSIYENRPFLCRLFGTIDQEANQLRCPHGCGPLVPLTENKANELMEYYLQLGELEGLK